MRMPSIGAREWNDVRAVARPILWAALLGGAGCSPALDWREFEPEGVGLRVTFPCRPDRIVREVPTESATLRWTMLSCTASGSTFALGYADVEPSARPDEMLAALERAAVARSKALHLSAAVPAVPDPAASVSTARLGTSASPPAFSELSVDGRGPDGGVIAQRMRFFAIGRRVYQATLVGPSLDAATIGSFLDGMRRAR